MTKLTRTISLALLLSAAHVAAFAASVVLSAPTGTAVFGQPVTLTATITPNTASGNVTFYDGVTVLGIRSASGGSAAFTTSMLASGTHSLIAYYRGDINNSPARSAALPFAISTTTAYGFFPLSYYNTDNFYPAGVATGDFNGDGYADFAVVSTAPDYISVYLGNGNGTFQSALVDSAGARPLALAVGDFNDDGKQDLAVANGSVGNVSILLGNGDGTFQSPVNYGVGSSPACIAVGDFNGDGQADLAVVNWGSDTVTILIGAGDGTFQPATDVPTGNTPQAIVVADFDGDGIPDLAVTNSNQIVNSITGPFGPGSVGIFLGNGDGTFRFSANYTAAQMNPGAIAVGDLNGDGKPDLAVTDIYNSYVYLFPGNGDGTFQAVTTIPVGYDQDASTTGLAIFDANGDGIPDIAVMTQFGFAGNLDLLLGLGHGGFQPYGQSVYASSPRVGGSVESVVAADFNGDGRVDLVFNLEGVVGVLLGNSVPPILTQTITFTPPGNLVVGAAPVILNATATSGLNLTFTSNTPNVCSLSGTGGYVVMPLMSGGCSITATQAGNQTYAAAVPVTQTFTVLFNDVSPSDIFYNEVNALAQYGITSGCGNNDFCPAASVTRDEMAIFIVRAVYGSDNFTYNATPYFTDVTPSTFAFKWIQKLKDLGITAGCTATTYCPTEVVTRDQMAVFIIRARLGLYIAGSPPTFSYPSTPYFTDVTAADVYFPWIQRLKLENITGGCTATTYCPTDPVTREEMATLVMRGAFNLFLPAGTPVVTQISPSTLSPGSSGTFTITSSNTNFVQGTTQLSPIPGVTIGTITVTSATTMTVQLSASAGAVTQPYSILAITGSEQDILPNGLVIQ